MRKVHRQKIKKQKYLYFCFFGGLGEILPFPANGSPRQSVVAIAPRVNYVISSNTPDAQNKIC